MSGIEIVDSVPIEVAGGIVLKCEMWRLPGSPVTQMVNAYSAKDGGYIGGPETAAWLRGLGIVPETPSWSRGETCSVGFCERERKWYGWSHRAFHGFGIGDVVEEGSCCASSGWSEEYLAERPEADRSLPVGFKAETLDDAKRMAEAFAECVS